MGTRTRFGTCLVVALCSAAECAPLEADNPVEPLTAHYWHAARAISVYGEAGFIYADMKFHADGRWTQFYRSYVPSLSGCHRVGDDVVSVGRWRREGGHILISGSHRSGANWKASATLRMRDGYLELVDGQARFEAADSVAGGFGCQRKSQAVFEAPQDESPIQR